jgi:2-polyprenyl-3-methyl-5-hydroxy-6-metoxy-1,4-benzoquinol methylase
MSGAWLTRDRRARHHVARSDDASRTLYDYDQMVDAHADDADRDLPGLVPLAGDLAMAGVRGSRVLDAGCAAGGLAELLVARGAMVVGLTSTRP